MPLTLSDLKRDERTVTLEVGEDDLNVTYRPGEITPERTDRIRVTLAILSDDEVDFEDQPTQAEVWEDVLAMITGWDIQDDEGNDLPVSVATIQQVPVPLLSGILEAIMEDARPPKKKSRRSRGRSF